MPDTEPYQPLVHYITIERILPFPIGQVWGIVASFGGEKPGTPAAKPSLSPALVLPYVAHRSPKAHPNIPLPGVGALRTFHYQYPPGTAKAGEEYTFSEELTAVDADNHSMTFRVRRPDYPEMVAFGTTALDEVGVEKGKETRFIWSGQWTPMSEEWMDVLRKDLDLRLNGLIDDIAGQLAK